MRQLLTAVFVTAILALAAMPSWAEPPKPPKPPPPPPHVGIDQETVVGTRPGGGTGGLGGAGSGGASGTAQQVVNDAPIYDVGLGENSKGKLCWRIETGGNQTLGEAREMPAGSTTTARCTTRAHPASAGRRSLSASRQHSRAGVPPRSLPRWLLAMR